ncbi:uncharacterized protein LOC141814290 [Curcuma longa]|uniref:uncharacterized protein LOC141814290 n=1 Tax=Curcuma longa TaxID=136217 RepID=UPI003D9E3367
MERGEMMDKYAPASSTARCFCFPCLILSLALVSAAVLIIIFVLKPRKPSFHLHAVEMGSSDAVFSKGSNDSSTMLVLFFVAQNPNKLGIRYSSSELGLVYDSNNMGLIKVPTFFQPAHSTNVSVLVHVFFKRIDVAEIVSEHTSESSSSLSDLEVRVFGGIHVRAHIFNFQLFKTQVFLDCLISAKLTDIALSKVFTAAKSRKAFLLSSLPHLTQKCSLALCI